jgi:hypothetical protein
MSEPTAWASPNPRGPAGLTASDRSRGPESGSPGGRQTSTHSGILGNGRDPGASGLAAEAVTIPLRPLDLAELLDGAIANIRRNPGAVLGISLIITSTIQVTIAAGAYFLFGTARTSITAVGTTAMPSMLAVFAANLLLTGVAILIMAGLLGPIVGRTILGRGTQAGRVWAHVRPRAVRMPLTACLPLLISLATVGVGFAPMAALIAAGAHPAASALAGIVGGTAGIVGAIWLYVVFALSAPAVVLERGGIIAGLRRSAQLVRRRWWRTFGTLMLAMLLTFLIGTGMQLPFDIAAALSGALGAGPPNRPGLTVAIVIETAGRVVSGTLTNPFNAGVTALLYADNRIRREGFDLELRTKVRSRTGAQARTRESQAPGPEQARGRAQAEDAQVEAADGSLDALDISPDELAALWRPSELAGPRRLTDEGGHGVRGPAESPRRPAP